MLAGGGTTCVASVPTPDARDCDPAPDAVGGGGTGFVRMSPVAELPQLFRSRLTCDGGGATTAGVWTTHHVAAQKPVVQSRRHFAPKGRGSRPNRAAGRVEPVRLRPAPAGWQAALCLSGP